MSLSFCTEMQLNYSKVPETVKKSSHEKISNAHGNDTCLRIGEELITVEEVNQLS